MAGDREPAVRHAADALGVSAWRAGVKPAEKIAHIDALKKQGRTVMMVGDGMNDAEMLSMAGKGCIMQNAHQRLKDLHPELEVIGSNADNAVPKYLRKLFLE